MRGQVNRHSSAVRAPVGSLAFLSLLFADAGLAQQSAATRPAGTANFGLQITGGYSDNIRHVAVNEESGSYRALGVNFDYVRDGNRVDMDLLGNVEERTYYDKNIDSEPLGSINASVDLAIVPQTLIWETTDSYSQGRVNQLLGTGPTNRQTINVVSTGPRLNLPLGSRTFLRSSAAHTRSKFGSSNQLDNERRLYEAGLYRALSSVSELGFAATEMDVEFDNFPIIQEIDSYFISYSRQLASGNASISAGENTVTVAGDKGSTPFLDLIWNRNIGARSELSITFEKGISDVAGAFLRSNTPLTTGPGPNNALLLRNTFESSRLGLRYSITYERSSLSIGGSVGESRYNQAGPAFSNDDKNLIFSFQRTISPTMQMSLAASVYDREFTQVAQSGQSAPDTKNVFATLSLRKSFARRFSLEISMIRDSQSGQTAFVYDETAARLSLAIDLNP